jgi:class 3 adenylate cyclase
MIALQTLSYPLSGTITVLFTDIEGSTKLARDLALNVLDEL